MEIILIILEFIRKSIIEQLKKTKFYVLHFINFYTSGLKVANLAYRVTFYF